MRRWSCDTVCQPTKDRQTAVEELCRQARRSLGGGGHHSNNTRQLCRTIEAAGCLLFMSNRVVRAQAGMLCRLREVGLTAEPPRSRRRS